MNFGKFVALCCDSKYNYRFPLQSFNFELFQNIKWRDVYFQFVQWAKSVVLEWSNHKGIDVQSYKNVAVNIHTIFSYITETLNVWISPRY